jgi:hypothetical protein
MSNNEFNQAFNELQNASDDDVLKPEIAKLQRALVVQEVVEESRPLLLKKRTNIIVPVKPIPNGPVSVAQYLEDRRCAALNKQQLLIKPAKRLFDESDDTIPPKHFCQQHDDDKNKHKTAINENITIDELNAILYPPALESDLDTLISILS